LQYFLLSLKGKEKGGSVKIGGSNFSELIYAKSWKELHTQKYEPKKNQNAGQ
jgi:hypothetical protein